MILYIRNERVSLSLSLHTRFFLVLSLSLSLSLSQMYTSIDDHVFLFQNRLFLGFVYWNKNISRFDIL